MSPAAEVDKMTAHARRQTGTGRDTQMKTYIRIYSLAATLVTDEDSYAEERYTTIVSKRVCVVRKVERRLPACVFAVHADGEEFVFSLTAAHSACFICDELNQK